MSMLSNNTTIGGKKPLLPSNEYTDNGPSKEKLGIVYENITGSVNLNNYRTEGNYTFYNLTNAYNFPFSNTNSHLTVQRFKDSNYCVQIITKQSSFEMYIRYCYNSAWSSWQKIWNASNDGTNSGLDADLLDGKHASEFALKSETNLQETDLILADERAKYYGDKDIIPSDESYFTVNATGEMITGLTDEGKTKTSLVIPYKINGVKITSIYDGAFYNCILLTKIIIPNSVLNIGLVAFKNCSALIEIKIPNNVSRLRDSIFAECSSLTKIIIPNNITTIDAMAFHGCTSLTSIQIPNSTTYIDNTAFTNCPNLTIYCEQGNYTETYAKTNNIPVVYTDVKAEILNGKVDKASLIEATAEDIDNWIGTSDTTSVVGEATAGNAIVGM